MSSARAPARSAPDRVRGLLVATGCLAAVFAASLLAPEARAQEPSPLTTVCSFEVSGPANFLFSPLVAIFGTPSTDISYSLDGTARCPDDTSARSFSMEADARLDPEYCHEHLVVPATVTMSGEDGLRLTDEPHRLTLPVGGFQSPQLATIAFSEVEGTGEGTVTFSGRCNSVDSMHIQGELGVPLRDERPPSVSISGTLREREEDALYGASYLLKVAASDGSAQNPQSGVRSIDILVDGISQLPLLDKPCLEANCSLTRDFVFASDAYEDGWRRIEVVVKDQAGNVTREAWRVLNDRRGSVYEARLYAEPPALGGELITREWAELGTLHGRSEDGLGGIATRDVVECDQDQLPPPDTCDEVRILRPADDVNAEAQEGYLVYRGSSQADPDLPRPIKLLERPETEETGSGPIGEAVEPWQVLPPVHGTRFMRFDDVTDQKFAGDPPESVQVRRSVWIDEATGFPLKTEGVSLLDGSVLWRYYWTYEKARAERAELPPDHFAVGRPPGTGRDERATLFGDAPLGPQIADASGASFTPYALGDRALVGTTEACLSLGAVVSFESHYPPDEAGGDPEAPAESPTADETYSEIDYLPASSAGCDESGLGNAEPMLSVQTFPAESGAASEWRSTYMEHADDVQANPTDPTYFRAGVVDVFSSGVHQKAYLITIDEERSSVLLEVGESTLIITGEFGRAEVPALVEQLEPR